MIYILFGLLMGREIASGRGFEAPFLIMALGLSCPRRKMFLFPDCLQTQQLGLVAKSSPSLPFVANPMVSKPR